VLVFHTVLCLLLQMVVLAIYFAGNGFGFDLRAFTFANPTLRPVAQLVSFYSVLIASHCLARYVEKKERVLLGCTLCLTLGMVFFGERSNLLNIYLNVLLCYLVQLRTRVSLIRIAGTGFFIGAGALYLGSVRAGNYSISEFFKAFAGLVLFGNTFSDLRDFGWVYARWDHVFWAGKTYLAALMSFIPRFASTFRDTWGLGVATSSTVGFDPQVHPGLRPGSFGESFFNFGVPGVLVVGLMLGIILRRLDIEVKKALAGPRPSMMEAFAATMLMSVAGCLTLSVNVSELYVLLGLYGFSWICLRVQQLFRVQGSAVVEPG
jgi:oligosaccharide repeat unit polymerase